jgi:hypothetical protein
MTICPINFSVVQTPESIRSFFVSATSKTGFDRARIKLVAGYALGCLKGASDKTQKMNIARNIEVLNSRVIKPYNALAPQEEHLEPIDVHT